MNRKTIVMALIFALMSTAAYADPVDNSSTSQGKETSAPAGGASYFDGVWEGVWELSGASMAGTTKQDVTIAIDKINPKGFHKTKYSFGWGKAGQGANTPPGSIDAYGKEQDGVFTFGWKNKEGTKITVKLEKYKDDVVKARLDREGASSTMQRPFSETYLKRK